MYTIGEILDKKKVSMRSNHRWTEDETNDLLDNIIQAIKTTGNSFERPTARKFYSEFCTTDSIFEADWIVKKHKMRHLKATYIKARKWNDNVASEMFESDKKHIRSRIKQICPFYNKLDEIFGQAVNADPIAPNLIMEDETTFKGIDNEDSCFDETNSLLIPKQEHYDEIDEAAAEESEIELLANTNLHSIPKTINTKTENYHKTKDIDKLRKISNERKEQLTDIEKIKFYFEKEKFQVTYRLEVRKLNLEKEKLEFEKVKFYETQKLRKYELDKQFELRKLEIEKEARFQRLEFEEENNEN